MLVHWSLARSLTPSLWVVCGYVVKGKVNTERRKKSLALSHLNNEMANNGRTQSRSRVSLSLSLSEHTPKRLSFLRSVIFIIICLVVNSNPIWIQLLQIRSPNSSHLPSTPLAKLARSVSSLQFSILDSFIHFFYLFRHCVAHEWLPDNSRRFLPDQTRGAQRTGFFLLFYFLVSGFTCSSINLNFTSPFFLLKKRKRNHLIFHYLHRRYKSN